jgi:YD repeat-containing protein
MYVFVLMVIALLCPVVVQAQSLRYPWEEYDKLIQRQTDLTAADTTLFGDSLDMYTGALGFSATDMSIPGTGLPIAVSRSMSIGNRSDYRFDDLPMADWNLELPRLSGVFLASTGWGSACSNNGSGAPPTVTVSGRSFFASEYWQGNRMIVPGRGSQEMLVAEPNALPRPSSGGPYPWLTQELTWFSCLPARKNGGGEAFVAHTADGLRYTFDWEAAFHEPDVASPSTVQVITAARRRVELYATKVEDRFGNWVAYRYSNASGAPVRLEAITSSDGRSITLAYNARGHVEQISNGTQIVRYRYVYPASLTGSLVGVDLPDGSSWAIDAFAMSHIEFQYERSTGAGDILRTCGYPGLMVNEPGATAQFVHPSGAVGEFVVGYSLRGRSNVPMVCNGYSTPNNDPNDDVARYPMAYHGVVLRNKRISGPGIDLAEWAYSYGGSISFAPGTGPVCTSGDCSLPVCLNDACAGTAVTTVSGPEGSWARHTYGNSYRYNEGQLLKVETGSGPQSILETTEQRYLWPLAGSQFATRLGSTQQPRTAGYTAEYLRPNVETLITRDGTTFSRKTTALDGLARPLATIASSSLGYQRTDTLQYHDDFSRWVLGQVARRVNVETGAEVARTVFDSGTALPVEQYAFGERQMWLSYHADGQVESVTDGNGNITIASGWRRGIPQVIGYADGFTESAVVDALGRVVSTTDENGFSSTYGYDAMGRLAARTYPAGDTVAWHPVSRTFERVGAEYGLGTGHWRLTETEGNRRRRLHFDAFWRPVLEESQDISDAQTTTQVVSRYDKLGRKVFTSYPTQGVTDVRNSLPGVTSSYDALGRVVRTQQDSELGLLTSSTAYLSGFRRQVTNPRGAITVEAFQAWDSPSYDFPTRIDAPLGVSTVIQRDVFGKVLEITRTGAGQ